MNVEAKPRKSMQKLELTWVGKDDPISIEPRILLEDAAKSNTAHDPNTENLLIHGDNLLALKAIEKKYAGLVKCIYIDPPYNTGAAFAQYDDNLEHSQWLNLMRPRLEILRGLLAKDGSIWISIDDDEGHYLKVLCDEVFGRHNFVATCIWHKKGTRSNDARWFSDNHDFVLVYASDKLNWRMNLLPRSEESIKGYSNPDNDPRGVWASGPCHAKTPNEKDIYEITTPSGRKIKPPPGTSWRFSKERFAELVSENRIWFGKNGDNVPRFKRFFTDVQDGFVPTTIWFRDEVGDNQEAKKEVKAFNPTDVFATPKPERLVQRILTLGSNPGDLVLDSFLGSGTTAAVAHKMGRRWIGVEMGDHAYTHCKVRLDKVIAGEDKGGITKAVNWQGGGGYRFYELAPTLVKFDMFGEAVINEKYNAEMLAAAVALHEGYEYAPDAQVFWKQANSETGGKSWLFTTTRHVSSQYLASIAQDMEEGEFLVVVCKSYDSGATNAYPCIKVKKIPQSLLKKCEFGKESYALNVVEDEENVEEEE